MILSMTAQAWLFLSAVLVGAAIGILYDVFRVFRKTARHSGFAVQLEDLFFWLAATGLTFYYVQHRNSGEIRPFYILGVAIGAVLYFATVSRYVVLTFVAVINFMKRVIMTVIRIIAVPVRIIASWLAVPLRKAYGTTTRQARRAKRYGKRKLQKTARDLVIFWRKV